MYKHSVFTTDFTHFSVWFVNKLVQILEYKRLVKWNMLIDLKVIKVTRCEFSPGKTEEVSSGSRFLEFVRKCSDSVTFEIILTVYCIIQVTTVKEIRIVLRTWQRYRISMKGSLIADDPILRFENIHLSVYPKKIGTTKKHKNKEASYLNTKTTFITIDTCSSLHPFIHEIVQVSKFNLVHYTTQRTYHHNIIMYLTTFMHAYNINSCDSAIHLILF